MVPPSVPTRTKGYVDKPVCGVSTPLSLYKPVCGVSTPLSLVDWPLVSASATKWDWVTCLPRVTWKHPRKLWKGSFLMWELSHIQAARVIHLSVIWKEERRVHPPKVLCQNTNSWCDSDPLVTTPQVSPGILTLFFAQCPDDFRISHPRSPDCVEHCFRITRIFWKICTLTCFASLKENIDLSVPDHCTNPVTFPSQSQKTVFKSIEAHVLMNIKYRLNDLFNRYLWNASSLIHVLPFAIRILTCGHFDIIFDPSRMIVIPWAWFVFAVFIPWAGLFHTVFLGLDIGWKKPTYEPTLTYLGGHEPKNLFWPMLSIGKMRLWGVEPLLTYCIHPYLSVSSGSQFQQNETRVSNRRTYEPFLTYPNYTCIFVCPSSTTLIHKTKIRFKQNLIKQLSSKLLLFVLVILYLGPARQLQQLYIAWI